MIGSTPYDRFNSAISTATATGAPGVDPTSAAPAGSAISQAASPAPVTTPVMAQQGQGRIRDPRMNDPMGGHRRGWGGDAQGWQGWQPGGMGGHGGFFDRFQQQMPQQMSSWLNSMPQRPVSGAWSFPSPPAGPMGQQFNAHGPAWNKGPTPPVGTV